MKTKVLLSCLLFFSLTVEAGAQFYTLGSDPGSVKWSQIETPAYKIIYPAGMDSLAGVYAVNLESARKIVGNTSGFTPNESYRKKMPVVLHTLSATDNGMVTWAPRRMDLLTIPSAYRPDPYPNESLLTIHESRHVSQMQFGSSYPFRWLNVIFGEMATGALSAIYPGPAFFEGDAVAAETALTNSGRGRNGDFLEYYRVSFNEGVNRNWWQWRWGSFNKYTPDYYRAGYLLMAGVRSVYDVPDFTAKYYERLKKHHGFVFGNLQKTIAETTGKSFDGAYREICDTLEAVWSADRELRGPFPEPEQITESQRLFTSYNHLETIGADIYAVRSGLSEAASLVRISPDGRQTRISSFASSSSALRYSEATGRLFWAERLPDPRWEMRSFSDIRYTDASGKTKNLTSKQRFFNPAPEGSVLAVTEYPAEGGSNIVILDAVSGQRLEEFRAPSGMQFVEAVWADGVLYASAITDGGFGIWKVAEGTCLLGPVPVKMHTFFSRKGQILFTSDATGVSELYSFAPSDGTLVRLTNTPDGAADFRFSSAGDSLYCTILSTGGRNICLVPATPEKVENLQRFDYPLADRLSAGEPEPFTVGDAEISDPKKYSKLGHLIKFHSWAPLFVDIDKISSLSLESVSSVAGLGATALFQNELGSAWGSVAYHAGHSSDGWHHSGHATFTYEGWYPVIKASLDLGDRNSYSSVIGKDDDGNTVVKTAVNQAPLFTYGIESYIPLTFNRGGLLSGLVPKIKYYGSNDTFEGAYVSSLNVSLRGYLMQRTAASCIYPRLGLGAEAGYFTRPGLQNTFCPNIYGLVYAYLPGIGRTHGIRISATGIRNFSTGAYVNTSTSTTPRGFPSSASSIISGYPNQAKFSFDYALPFASLDWAGLCPAFYLRNFELFAHADYSTFNVATGKKEGSLYSVGADFKLHLSNFLWIPYDTRIGVSYNYNGGASFDEFAASANGIGHNTVELIFSIDL